VGINKKASNKLQKIDDGLDNYDGLKMIELDIKPKPVPLQSDANIKKRPHTGKTRKLQLYKRPMSSLVVHGKSTIYIKTQDTIGCKFSLL